MAPDKDATLTVSDVQKSIQKFNDYTADLMRANYLTFDDRLHHLFEFCEKDRTFSDIHRQIMDVPGAELEKWFPGNQRGMRKFKLPTDDEDRRIAVMYRMLHAFYTGTIQWESFCLSTFRLSSSSINDHLYALNENVIEPLVRDLGYRLTDVLEALPKDRSDTVSSASIQIVHHAENVIQQSATGNHIQQNANISNSPELQAKLDELRELIRTTSQQVTEDLELLEKAQQEATSSGKKSVVNALLQGISVAGSAGSIISAVLGLLS